MLWNGCVQKSNKKSSHTGTHANTQCVIISMSWIACFYHSDHSTFIMKAQKMVWIFECVSVSVSVLYFSMGNALKIDKIDSSNWFYSHTHTPAYRGILIIYDEIYIAYIINISMSMYNMHGIWCVCWLAARYNTVLRIQLENKSKAEKLVERKKMKRRSVIKTTTVLRYILIRVNWEEISTHK